MPSMPSQLFDKTVVAFEVLNLVSVVVVVVIEMTSFPPRISAITNGISMIFCMTRNAVAILVLSPTYAESTLQ